MKAKILTVIILSIGFFMTSVNGQTKSSKVVCNEEDECCKKTSGKKTSTNKLYKAVSNVNKEKVVSCKLTSPELQKRKAEVIALLKASVLQRKEINNGYQYSFKGTDQMVDDVVSFIKTERACCDFFTFNLSVEDDASNILLTITGPKGTKEFIKEEMDL